MAGKSRNTIGHVLRVRVINGSVVILEFELGVIIGPLGKWMRGVWSDIKNDSGLIYQIIAHRRTCYGLITIRNYDLNRYLINIFDHTFGNFVNSCSRFLTSFSSLISWICPMSLAQLHLHFMIMALTVDFIFENRVMLAAKIISGYENCFWLRKRFPAAETETAPPRLHKDS